MATSGGPVGDAWRRRERALVDAQGRKLAHMIFGRPATPSLLAARRYYEGNRAAFGRPASRDIRAIVVRDLQAAHRAAAAVRGDDWAVAARRFSIEPSARRGGWMTIDRRNALAQLRGAVFAAPLHRPVGPFRVLDTWWIIEIVRDRPAGRVSFASARASIDRLLREEQEERNLTRLSAELRRIYRPRTRCVAGLVVPRMCADGR